MSDRALIDLLEKAGMPHNAATLLFDIFRKKISPNPKGYLASEAITRLMVSNCFSYDFLINKIADKAKMAVVGNMSESRVPIPWYWLSLELGEDLTFLGKPKAIPQNIVLPRMGIIVLPQRLIETTDGTVDFLAYYLFHPGEKSSFGAMTVEKNKKSKFLITEAPFEGTIGHRLCWFTSIEKYIYGGIIGLIPEGNSYQLLEEETETLEDEMVEKKESDRITAILLNCLVYASQNETEYSIAQNKGFGKIHSSKKKLYTRPIFIGKDHVSVVRKAMAKAGIKGSSKKIHWRKGFYRYQAHGKNYSEHSWRLIAPTIVGFNNSKQQ